MTTDSALLADFAAFFAALPQTVAAIRAEVREATDRIIVAKLGRDLDRLSKAATNFLIAPGEKPHGWDWSARAIGNDVRDLQIAAGALPDQVAAAVDGLATAVERVKARSGR